MIERIIRRPILVAMIIIGLCLLGVVSYTKLPVELIPYTELPMLVVQVSTALDADPDYVEKHAIIPLESAIAGLEDIESIESYIDRRRAIIFVYYHQNSDAKYAYLKLQERVESARSLLGDDFYASVLKIDTEQLSNQFMSLQARGEGDLDQIREVVDEEITEELEKIDGIASVAVYGGRQHSIEVVLDEGALRSHNITASQVSSKISGGTADRQYLGQAIEGNKQYFVNLTADYTAVPALEDIVIKEEGPVLLKHVATIIDGGAEEETISRVNGMESISISLVRDQQANLLSLSRETRREIEHLNKKVAATGVELVIQSDSAEEIEENIEVIKMLALIGGLLAVVVLWLFLRNLPLVLVVAASIPISVLISLNFFYAFDITINTLTLVGIAIAIGMLIDNSVVVLENIHRKVAHGNTPYRAVVDGTHEVWRAVSAATLTTVCVFVPFIFSNSFLVKTLGRHVGISIISTLLVSLGVAFVLIPPATYYFLSRKKGRVESFNVISQKNRLQQIYTLLLKSCLRFPARTLIVSVVVFFASVLICLAVSINVPEEVELDEFNLYATMPSGTTLATADEQVKEMDQRLSDIAELKERRANIEEDNIVFTFELKEDYEDIARRNLSEVKDEVLEKLSNAYPLIDFTYEEPASDVRFRGGGGGGQGMRGFTRLLGIGTSEESVVIRGQDLGMLRSIAEDVRYNLDNLETIKSTQLSVTEHDPGIDLLLDQSAMRHFNVGSANIIAELSGFQSEVSSGVTLKRGTDEIDIILKKNELEDKTSDDLRELEVAGGDGGTVPIVQLARFLYTSGTSNINRVNQEKEVSVVYRFEDDVESSKPLLENARLTVDEIAAGISPPSGVAIEVVHDETDLSEFYFLIFAAVILIYMILASVFESLATPLVIMFTIPLATIGALWGLILTGNSILNANSIIGLFILLGVVVNNGIILIDYSRLLRRQRMRPGRALITAGQARIRPILITAITTVLAMLPLAMGKAEYVAKIGAPFAIVVIGGLSFGTLFTLLLIPTVSFGTDNAMAWWRQLSGRNKAIQTAVLIIGVFLIYKNIDSFLWQMVDLIALLAVIPAFTYFTQTSLRRSRRAIIPTGDSITITIRNVVKVYDDFSRFVREWRKGERQHQHGSPDEPVKNRDLLLTRMWQLPLYVFLFYFTYLYLESGFWIFVFSVVFYIYSLNLWRPLLLTSGISTGKWRWPRTRRWLYKLIFWLGPLLNLIWFKLTWSGLALVIVLGFAWYLAALTYNTSSRLYRKRIDINRLTGRFVRIRKFFYRLVKATPLIGKRRVPFVALNQVSMEIGSGMFGLVGPNGAGKTTLMRVICGILPPARGTVKINGIDLVKQREELQSLIGYLPQEFGTYENMTAYQFLDYQALLKGQWNDRQRRETVEKAIHSVHLEDSRNTKIKSFSGGMKQRVGIAQTLLHLPRIMVVDEPTAGLDPRERIRFRNLLSELARDRVVIFSTHIIEDISSSCSRLAVLDDGAVKFLGSPREMVELTRGYVWQAQIAREQFEKVRNNLRIVHHMRDGDLIRVRVLASKQPLTEAIEVTPTLEDSYLWLLNQQG